MHYVAIKKKGGHNKIQQGDKVWLDEAAIIGDPNWERKVISYRLWCKEHFGEVFTVLPHNNGSVDLWQLEEDGTNPRWLFHSSDLTVVL